MLKKTITYDDYSEPPQTLVEDFYFNLTEREAAELDLEHGGIEETVRRLMETSDGPAVYKLFKEILLATYGRKSLDNKRFIKKDDNGRPLSEYLEESPALDELIIPMLKDSSLGAEFFKGVLPAKTMQRINEVEQAQKSGAQQTEMPAGATTSLDAKPEPTDEELLAMDFSDMTPDQQKRAYVLKTSPPKS